jgi:hypothetical protein
VNIREYRRSFRNGSNTDRDEIPDPKINKTKKYYLTRKKERHYFDDAVGSRSR